MDASHRIPSTEEQRPAPETGERQSQRVLLWGSIALLALVVLLGSLMSQQLDVSWGGPGERLMLQLPDPVVYALLGFFTLGGVAVLAVLFPREFRLRRKKKPDEFQLYQEPPKFSPGVFVVLLLAALIPIGLIVYLYWSGWEPFGEEQELQQQAPLVRVEPLPREAPTEKPATEAPGFAWTLFILAALVGLGMLGGGAWVLFGDRLERWWYGMTLEDETRQALLEAVEISLDDLLREPDPRRAVIACYRRLEHVLGQHGLPRAPWQTPLEYLHAILCGFHPPAMLLRGLTTLFELAKFSAHPLGESEKHLAIDALREVKTALEEEHHVPTT
jgi:Domain of unknown function (DUF4129)